MTDSTDGRSIIQTAAHCVYDDTYRAFARNVLFIPNQAGTTGAGTDLNCSNDPFGCWTLSFGVVDVNWTTRTFPDNVTWDYAYYVFKRQLGSCGLSGGSSGGPWMQPFNGGTGSLISVNSVGLYEPAGHGRAEAKRYERFLRVFASEEHGVRVSPHDRWRRGCDLRRQLPVIERS